MSRNPVLDLALSGVMRSEIALSLQSMKLHTVGSLLKAWGNPREQRGIEQIFDSPEQARHAMTTFACWLGMKTPALAKPVTAWWAGDVAPTPTFSPVSDN
jgi:hypothetical protein